jgi:hypothetical protein
MLPRSARHYQKLRVRGRTRHSDKHVDARLEGRTHGIHLPTRSSKAIGVGVAALRPPFRERLGKGPRGSRHIAG